MLWAPSNLNRVNIITSCFIDEETEAQRKGSVTYVKLPLNKWVERSHIHVQFFITSFLYSSWSVNLCARAWRGHYQIQSGSSPRPDLPVREVKQGCSRTVHSIVCSVAAGSREMSLEGGEISQERSGNYAQGMAILGENSTA